MNQRLISPHIGVAGLDATRLAFWQADLPCSASR
jgi:hypothetical protein